MKQYTATIIERDYSFSSVNLTALVRKAYNIVQPFDEDVKETVESIIKYGAEIITGTDETIVITDNYNPESADVLKQAIKDMN